MTVPTDVIQEIVAITSQMSSGVQGAVTGAASTRLRSRVRTVSTEARTGSTPTTVSSPPIICATRWPAETGGP